MHISCARDDRHGYRVCCIYAGTPNLAIALCLALRVVYGLPPRQTRGLMRSVATLMRFNIGVPDLSVSVRRRPSALIC